ncbi:hypothetical protein ABT095_08800 [Kitasatospora sp. NPDC002227]|uniref:hypothetical protein n=1 Tax=Kitasatospora sp. NPDC002227 TaxID=3154773 RepID=UPI003332D873
MEDIRIALPARQRRRLLIRLGLATAVLCGPFWWENWGVGLLVTAVWSPLAAGGLGWVFGSLLLTPESLHLRGPLRRRVVPWTEIGLITERTTHGRSSTYRIAIVYTTDRPGPRVLPGLRADSVTEEPDFERALATVRAYQRAVARRRSF